jgi:serralysin
MATKNWDQNSGNYGIGDWFTTSNGWSDPATQSYTTPPEPGDAAEIATGTVIITAADATVPAQSTLNGLRIYFPYQKGTGGVPTLDVTNETFGAQTTISDYWYGSAGVLVARGTVNLAGTLIAQAGPSLTLDIEPYGGHATFANTGMVEATNAGRALTVTGAAGAVFTNGGTLLAASGGTVQIATALHNDDQISSTYSGVLAVSGGVANSGTIVDLGGAVTLGSGVVNSGSIVDRLNGFWPTGSLEIDGGLTNTAKGCVIVDGCTAVVNGEIASSGTITDQSTTAGLDGAITVNGNVSNSGLISINNGTLTITGSLDNTGDILNIAGDLAIKGAVTGSGTITISDITQLGGSVAAGQVIAFASDGATLELGDPAKFHGTIAGLQQHDVIHITGVTDNTSYDSSTGMLRVFNGNAQVAAFTLQNGASLNVTADGHGGTVLTREQIGTPAQVQQYIINNSDEGGTPENWPTPNAVVYYTFDMASNWSSLEAAAFGQAMTFYSDIADITFKPADTAHPAQLIWVRGSDGQAATDSSDDGNGHLTAATISIDTSVPGWQNLYELGDYGFTTVVHELGHAIGFGHPGPYNDDGSVTNYLALQIFYTDTQQYTVMSYLPGTRSGADWVYNGISIYPQTPMLYDIGAAQAIYGTNTATLTGGDIFGFHSTFGLGSTHPISAYDFTQNAIPVVTLFDAGPNNTLDLSGFTLNSRINLNPGSFSDACGLTDNIAIAYNTTIDCAIGGSGNDTFIINRDNDTIDGGGGTNTVVFPKPRSSYTISFSSGIVRVSDGTSTDTLRNIQTLQFADQSQAACFTANTRILTARGEVPVQELRPGEDYVVTRGGRLAPVRWLGWRTLDPSRHPRPQDVMPIRVRTGAIGFGQPRRDLLLSPDHALALHGVLIPVRYLANGATIVREAWHGQITYYHVELDRHDILLAEGLPAESYLDAGNRNAFANGEGIVQLHPRFAPDATEALRIWVRAACAPLAIEGPALAAARAALLGRAEALGFAVSENPDLRVLAGGRVLHLLRSADRVRVHLPPRTASVQLLSRTWTPLEMADPSEDPRRLGIAVAGLRLGRRRLALDDARLLSGWHIPEAEWRWTDGAARIDTSGARVLEFRITAAGRYWLPAEGLATLRTTGRQ